jgi:DNA-binding transcriptional ArsR family regulator
VDAQILALAKRQAEVCKVFGSTTRILILWALDGREMSVGDVAEAIESSLQNTSQHLRLMKDRRILTSRREGHTVYYRINGRAQLQDCAVLRQALRDPLRNTDFISERSSEHKKQEDLR